ncbi:MAG: zf-TFIIB domain-containing protein [Thermoanaerobaculia bacterium]
MEKPSKHEEEYFRKQELAKRKQWEEERKAKLAAEEKQRLKELHHMKCPKCGMDLYEFDYQGVTLDRCLSCGGTWFDAGEMDRIIGGDQGMLGRMISFFR